MTAPPLVGCVVWSQGDVIDCDMLQFDLNAVYDWALSNNMFLSKNVVMFVLAPTCLPIMYILTLRLTL